MKDPSTYFSCLMTSTLSSTTTKSIFNATETSLQGEHVIFSLVSFLEAKIKLNGKKICPKNLILDSITPFNTTTSFTLNAELPIKLIMLDFGLGIAT